MAALNEAYEVLSNPGLSPHSIARGASLTRLSFSELRERFDNGEDPNDPASQNQGHPFQQGGNPFGGGHPFQQFFQQGGGGHTQFRWG